MTALILLALSLLPPAHAETEPEAAAAEHKRPPSQGQGEKGQKGKGGKHGKKGKKGKPAEPEWKKEVYAAPSAGLTTWNDGTTTSTAASVGAEAGVHYWQVHKPLPRWQGTTRVAGDYIMGSNNVSGYDVRLGSFIGPSWKYAGIQFGPDVYHNQYRYGTTELPPTTGVSVPVTATGWFDPVTVYAGIAPSWFLSSERESVNWGEADSLGFGDEFSIRAGASLRVDKLRVGVDFVRTETAYGTQQGYGLNMGYNR